MDWGYFLTQRVVGKILIIENAVGFLVVLCFDLFKGQGISLGMTQLVALFVFAIGFIVGVAHELLWG